MEENIKLVENLIKEYKLYGDLDGIAINDMSVYINALEHQIKAYKELKEIIQTQQAEIEKKDKWINKLETKLMYALTPTKHELAKRTQEEFKEIIRDNIDEDTYTIKRKLKENWNNL